MHFISEIISKGNFVELSVPGWAWFALIGFICGLLALDVLVIHRQAHVIGPREALAQTAVWMTIGLAFTGIIAWAFGASAAGEYINGYLVEQSLSIDNVFVWALILGFYKIPEKNQHRVLFWGIFGALALRAIFIFAGLALIEKFTWVLYLFGAFLLYTAAKLVLGDEDVVDPSSSRLLKVINKFIPLAPHLDEQRFFTRENGKRLATPLFAVLLLVEMTDVLFAVDSVPAVLAVSRDQFIVFSSNAFAILGLRSLYFLLADAHTRFVYLKEGLAAILAFVGAKMLLHSRVHISSAISLVVMAVILTVAIVWSIKADRAKSAQPPMH